MPALHVVIGAGPLGASVVRSLLARGLTVRIVSRTGTRRADGATVLAADVRTVHGVAAAVAGASVVYQCAQPPYHRWTEEFPPLQHGILDAAAAVGAALVLADNLYAYGPSPHQVITDDTPELARTKKGAVRRAMASAALTAHHDGRLRVAVMRPSNYFGPGYDLMGTPVFAKAVAGKRMQFLFQGDQPHSFSFIPDAGEAMAAIGTSDHGWGRAWITAIQPAMTQHALAERIWSLAGQTGPARTTYVSRRMLRVAGLFSPAAREVLEMSYEYEQPFMATSAEFEQAFDLRPTPLDDALARTLRAYGSHL